MKAFVSWSGGKETSLAYYKAIKRFNIKYLLNMISEDGRYSRSHGIEVELLRAQAKAIGIPLVQRRTTWGNYEDEFKKAVLEFKEEGVRHGIFGDIDLEEHREWVERVCKDIGIEPILPLWRKEREELLKEFIKIGFKAIVIATNTEFLGEEWLGRQIDEKFIEDLRNLKSIDLCGEKGEYHTFVYDGPIFKKLVKFVTGRKILKGKHCFLGLEILKEEPLYKEGI